MLASTRPKVPAPSQAKNPSTSQHEGTRQVSSWQSSQSTTWHVKNGICLDFVCLILGSGSLDVLQSYTEAHSGCKALLQPWEYHEMQKVGYPWLVLLCSVAGSQSTVRPVKSRKLRNRVLQ